jgi:chaperone LolA
VSGPTLHRLLITSLLLLTAVRLEAADLELDRAAAAMSGMEATFTHRFTPNGFKGSQVESGTVIFGRLPAMRWTYTTPESKIFVFDGTTSWFYVPADKQVTLSKVTEARKRELPFLLIGDPSGREKHFVVSEHTRGGTVVTTLDPRDATAVIRHVVVSITPATHLIRRIDYTDRDGNRTSFELSGYHPQAVAADTFTFTPPEGVEVIRAD